MQSPVDEFTVAFWNILFDINSPSLVKSQSERLPEITDALRGLPEDTIIGLAEVEGGNGQEIARQLQSRTRYFVAYDRPNDYIGVVSRLQLHPGLVDIDDKCRAVIAEYNGITIVVIHLTLAVFGESLRQKQVKTLLEKLNMSRPIVMMGDFNSMAWQKSRKLIKKAGFRSAFKRSIIKRMPTAPTPRYRHILPEPLKTLTRGGLSLDDIYVKDLEVLESGTFTGESDHRGVWARIRPLKRA